MTLPTSITGIQASVYPNVIIQDGTSVNGFSTVNSYWHFGTVKVVFPGCDKFQVGDSVFFDKTEARRFVSVSTNYFAVDQKFVFFIENPAVIIP